MSDLRSRLSGLALLLLAMAASCLPSIEPRIPENNVGLFMRANLACIRAEVNGLDSTLVVASALPRTAINSSLRSNRAGTRILLGDTLLTHVRSTGLDIAEIPADGLLGADAFRGKIATIDYFRGLLIVSDWPRAQPDITPWKFSGGPPRVPVQINGRKTWAIVDTALPDSAIVPAEFLDGGDSVRAVVTMEVGGIRFDDLDVAVVPVAEPRLGNRVLSRFVVTIDYAHEMIGIWPDPRTTSAARR